MEGCLACDLAEGRVPLPGGVILETGHWLVEHNVGPLGVGALIVKPRRHVVHVWELTGEESAELGPLLVRVAGALAAVTSPDQVYVTLWSHMDGVPVHIHWVVQAVTRALMDETGLYGPRLQLALIERGERPPAAEVEPLAALVRAELAR